MKHNIRITGFLLLAAVLAVFSGCALSGLGPSNAKRLDDRFESQISMARLSERHGDVQQAQAIYQAVIAKQYNNQLAHHRLAVIAAQHRQVDEANYHFREALTAGPASSELLNDWGYHLYLQHRLDDAETQFRQSLAQDSINQSAHNNLGLVLGEQGRFDEALAEFQLAGSQATAHANLAYVYTLNGELDRAEQAYHHALALDDSLKPAAEALVQLATRPRPPRADQAPTMTASYKNPAAGQADRQPQLAGTQRPAPALPRVSPPTEQFVTDTTVARQTPPPAAPQTGPPLAPQVAAAQPQPAPTAVPPFEQPTPPELTEFRPPTSFQPPASATQSVLVQSPPTPELPQGVTVVDRPSGLIPPAANAAVDSSIRPRTPAETVSLRNEPPQPDRPSAEPPVVDYTTRLADRRSVFTPPQTNNSQPQPWTWQPPHAAAQGPPAGGQ